MLELVDSTKLIRNEKYWVKGYKNRNIIFLEYDMLGGVEIAVCICVVMNSVIYLFTDSNQYYRYISEQEYKAKLKEKYDDTCLNIVLKRLVDDSFVWL
jgi:hypothetical protein